MRDDVLLLRKLGQLFCLRTRLAFCEQLQGIFTSETIKRNTIGLFHLTSDGNLRNWWYNRKHPLFQIKLLQNSTVEPRFNESLFNEVLDITNDILPPGQSYS